MNHDDSHAIRTLAEQAATQVFLAQDALMRIAGNLHDRDGEIIGPDYCGQQARRLLAAADKLRSIYAQAVTLEERVKVCEGISAAAKGIA